MVTITGNISITNPDPEPRKATIPAGMLIEIQTPGIQNVVVAKTVEVEIPGRSTKNVAVELYCINRDLKYPQMAKGQLTKSYFGPPLNNQQQAWKVMEKPATRKESPYVGLRKEMVDRLGSLAAFRMFVSDYFDMQGDDFGGDTITAKCFELIEYCKRNDLVDELITYLRAQFPRSAYFAVWTPDPPQNI